MTWLYQDKMGTQSPLPPLPKGMMTEAQGVDCSKNIYVFEQ
jgi:hypothetical protein